VCASAAGFRPQSAVIVEIGPHARRNVAMASVNPVNALRDMLLAPTAAPAPSEWEDAILPQGLSETDKQRVETRTAHVELGKNTLAYQRYRLLVPR
jgi:hypothetical protein